MIQCITNHLPPFVIFEGCTFQVVCVSNQDNTMELAYALTQVAPNCKHFECWVKQKRWKPSESKNTSKILVSVPGITDDKDLRYAVHQIIQHLQKLAIYEPPKRKKGHNYRRSSLSVQSPTGAGQTKSSICTTT